MDCTHINKIEVPACDFEINILINKPENTEKFFGNVSQFIIEINI